MSQPDLAPCPFCMEAKCEVKEFPCSNEGITLYCVRCLTCYGEGPCQPDLAMAIKLWNIRRSRKEGILEFASYDEILDELMRRDGNVCLVLAITGYPANEEEVFKLQWRGGTTHAFGLIGRASRRIASRFSKS